MVNEEEGGKGAAITATDDMCVPLGAANFATPKTSSWCMCPKKQIHVHRDKTDGDGNQTGGGTPDDEPCNTYMNVTMGTLLVGSQ